MSMDEDRFAEYAEELEREDFEEDILALSCSVRQLVDARYIMVDFIDCCSAFNLIIYLSTYAYRTETIIKLRASAEYLDSVWLRCKVGKTMGTSTSIVGGGLTIAGGILTTLTAGAAAPVLIAGIATSSVGAATNLGTSLVEKVVNSKQVKDMNAAFERDKEITLKLERQLEIVKHYQSSKNVEKLLDHVTALLGSKHLLISILRKMLIDGSSTDVADIQEVFDQESQEKVEDLNSQEESSDATTNALIVQSEEERLKYNPLDAGVLVESTKVIGQNSIRVAGQVIIGVSAAFMVWDAVDLGLTITDLIKRQGSKAARTLRDKAEMLETALTDTVAAYCIEMPR